MIEKPREGSTAQLLVFSACYFLLYFATGFVAKYFTESGPPDARVPQLAFQWYSTLGGALTCLTIVATWRWALRFSSMDTVSLAGIAVPREFLWMVPSGLCTAIIIPGTTMMYTFRGLSVMVAMVIMRGCVIVIGRAVDAIQLWKGIATRRVYWQENVAVGWAIAAVAAVLMWGKAEGQPFWRHPIALGTFIAYVIAYAIRIYIMNYYKNTRTERGRGDNRGFFAVEQAFAALGILLAVGAIAFAAPTHASAQEVTTAMGIRRLDVVAAGIPFGLAAFFSVFLLMFSGRTGTFAALVNRCTSLLAGTAATLATWIFAAGTPPKPEHWAMLACVLVAIGFLSWAEHRRTAERVA